jgi:hypothetical protein
LGREIPERSHEEFWKHRIEFAYSSQTLYLTKP